MAELDLLRLVLGSGFLLVAAVQDVRTRRVPNGLWLAFAGAGVLLFASDWILAGRLDWVDALVALGVIVLAYLLWYVHLLPGGADAKALMALAVLLPEPLMWSFQGAPWPLWTSPMPAVLVTLANSVVVSIFAPLALFAFNLSRGDRRFPAMLLGYTMPLATARERFVWVVDHIDNEGRRTQALFPSRLSEEEQRDNLARLQAAGLQRVWVTPKVPFMVMLLGGFLSAFFLGDVLFRLVQATVAALP